MSLCHRRPKKVRFSALLGQEKNHKLEVDPGCPERADYRVRERVEVAVMCGPFGVVIWERVVANEPQPGRIREIKGWMCDICPHASAVNRRKSAATHPGVPMRRMWSAEVHGRPHVLGPGFLGSGGQHRFQSPLPVASGCFRLLSACY